MIVFAVETSCDETSVAILRNRKILSHIVFNQEIHNKFGGVVPELASRSHLQILQSITPEVIKKAKIKISDIDVFCATCGPGLIGGLLVGSIFAKSLAIGLGKPFYPINHLEGHLLSPSFNNDNIFPSLSFLLTGGHTQIYMLKSIGNYQLIGETVDDAIGESFDKVAKLMRLNYPGGPEIEKWANKGNKKKFNLPHPMEKKNTLNFSFSGIKTAVNLIVKKNKKMNKIFKRNMAASFQNKIVEILEKKLLLSLNFIEKKNFNLNSISIVGGVACNKEIKKSFLKIAKKNKCKLVLPPKYMFSDNAAMIGWACLQKNKYIESDLKFKADPRLKIRNIK